MLHGLSETLSWTLGASFIVRAIIALFGFVCVPLNDFEI